MSADKRRTSDIDDILAASSSADAPPPRPHSSQSTQEQRPVPRLRSFSTQQDRRQEQLQNKYESLVSAYLDSHIPPSPTEGQFKQMDRFNPSEGQIPSECICQRILPSNDSIHCNICGNTIKALLEKRRERLTLLDHLDVARKDLEMEKDKTLRQIRENQKLLLRIKELEDALDLQADEGMTLRRDMQVLSNKLVKEVTSRAEVQAERDRLHEELAEFSTNVLDEANNMVKDERKKNWELEQSKTVIMKQLEKTKTKLVMGRGDIIHLKRHLSHLSAHVRKNSNADSILTVKNLNITSPEGEDIKEAVKPGPGQLIDTFTSIDVDMIPDKRLREDFALFVRKSKAIPLSKLSNQVPVFKQWLDDFVEPCARLGKFSSKKILESIMSNNLKIVTKTSQAVTPVEEKEQLPLPARSNAEQVPSPEKDKAVSPALSSLRSSLANTPELARASSPVKLWNQLTSSAVSSGDNLCGGCGKEKACEYKLVMNSSASQVSLNSNSNTQSTSPSSSVNIHVDVWCRDRVYAVFQFFQFIRQLEEQDIAESSEGHDLLDQLFIEFLRRLKNMFYARVGVMSYFWGIEQELSELKVTSMISSPEEELPDSSTIKQQQQQQK